MRTGLATLLIVISLHGTPAARAEDPAYRAQIEAWRRARQARLVGDEGWLTVAGLFWLKEGANRFGSDTKGDIVLPAHSAPAHAGIVQLRGKTVTVEVAPGAPITLAGKPVTSLQLKSDVPGPPDVLALGALRLFVIERGGRLAIRLRDLKAPTRATFKGLTWFPIREDQRIEARFVAHPQPTTIPVPSILGAVEPMISPGSVFFRMGNREFRLDPVLETPDATELFFIFKDATSGHETYGAGRFFYSDLPRDGRVVIDFNKAYTPPCAFTAFATCPLPPKQNRLPIRIEAGERDASSHGARQAK